MYTQKVVIKTVWNKRIDTIILDVAKDKNFIIIKYKDGTTKSYKLTKED